MQEEQRVYLYFIGSILLKGFISFGEIVVGGLLLVIPVTYLTSIGDRLAGNGVFLVSSPYLTAHISTAIEGVVSVGATFIGLYLISRGLIKFLLIVAMLKKILWAYPASLFVLGVFMTYQLYELFRTHSIAILLITCFDVVVMYFIWKEWKILVHATKGHAQK